MSLVDSPVQSPVYFGPAWETTAQNLQWFGSLAMQTQPGGAVSGGSLSPQPVVNVLNALGQVDTSFQGTVNVSIAGAGAITSGGAVNAVNGVATFNLRVTGAGASTLTFSVPGRISVTSNSFTMT